MKYRLTGFGFFLAVFISPQANALDAAVKSSAQTAKMPWSLSDTASGGLRFEVRPFERASSIGDSNKAVERSEVILGNAVFNKVAISSWSFRWTNKPGQPVPSSPYDFFLVGQWHAKEDKEDISASPPIAFDIHGGELKVCIRFSTDKILRRIPPLNCLYRGKIEQGRFYRLKHRVIFSSQVMGGELDVWLDGEQITKYRGPLGYNDEKPPYLKIGIYRGHSNDIDVVSYDDVVLSRH